MPQNLSNNRDEYCIAQDLSHNASCKKRKNPYFCSAGKLQKYGFLFFQQMPEHVSEQASSIPLSSDRGIVRKKEDPLQRG